MNRRLAASSGLITVGRIISVLYLMEYLKRRVFTLTMTRWDKVKCIFVISLFYSVLHKIPTYCRYSVRVKSGEHKGVSLRHIVEWNSGMLLSETLACCWVKLRHIVEWNCGILLSETRFGYCACRSAVYWIPYRLRVCNLWLHSKGTCLTSCLHIFSRCRNRVVFSHHTTSCRDVKHGEKLCSAVLSFTLWC